MPDKKTFGDQILNTARTVFKGGGSVIGSWWKAVGSAPADGGLFILAGAIVVTGAVGTATLAATAVVGAVGLVVKGGEMAASAVKKMRSSDTRLRSSSTDSQPVVFQDNPMNAKGQPQNREAEAVKPKPKLTGAEIEQARLQKEAAERIALQSSAVGIRAEQRAAGTDRDSGIRESAEATSKKTVPPSKSRVSNIQGLPKPPSRGM